MKRLGSENPKEILLGIDEISALPYNVLGATEHALRCVFNNDLPFGGISVILVGDFDQKGTVQRGTSLAQILVNSVTDAVSYVDDKGVSKRNVTGIFGKFKKYELTTNHRLKGEQKELRAILRRLRTHPRPITRGFLKSLPQLKRQDQMTTAERAKWKFCPVMVTGNPTRHRINEFKGIEFGREKNVPILEFYDGVSNITDPDKLAEISRMVRLQSPIKRFRNSHMLVVVYQTLRHSWILLTRRRLCSEPGCITVRSAAANNHAASQPSDRTYIPPTTTPVCCIGVIELNRNISRASTRDRRASLNFRSLAMGINITS